MKKKWICALLAAVMLFGMISMTAVNVRAASELKASESGIFLIKQLEGFQPVPKLDYSQYSVGYGSACDPEDYPIGITEAQADALLRRDVAKLEDRVNAFADQYGLTFNQNQFDALISFTYNVGAGWMNDAEGAFRNAVVNSSTGNDFIFAIARWSTAGVGDNKAVQTGLVQRRLAEANLYLNGVYSTGVPANYTYVLYNTNIANCTNTIRIQAYDTTVGDTVKAEPTKSGYYFLGWYTAAEGGKQVTKLNASTARANLYAHWQEGAGSMDTSGNVAGVAANYVVYAAASGNQAVYEQPKSDAAVLRTLAANAELTVVADYMDNVGTKWGKISDGGWISLAEASGEMQPADVFDEPLVVTVTTNGVNVRFGPGTNYAKVGTAYKGQQLNIVGVQKGGQYLWGKFSEGWICLDYTNYETAKVENSESSSVVTAIGTVIRTTKLNVRSGPGTGYAAVGSLSGGQSVEIMQQQTVNGKVWYKIAQGWIHSYYVQVTTVDTEDDNQTTDPTETTTPPTETTTPSGSGSNSGSSNGGTVVDTGTIFNCDTLRIRAAAGTNNACVGTLARGTKVEIYDYTVVRGAVWGKIAQGWIHMSYVKMDEAATDAEGVVGTVVNCTKVNVRSGAGTAYAKVGQLAAGTKVQVLQLMQLSSGKVWARVAQGWIHTDYLKLSTSNAGGSDNSGSTNSGNNSENTNNGTAGQPSAGTGNTDIIEGTTSDVTVYGTIVKTNSLRVRSGPGVGYAHVADLAGGDRVEIVELRHVGSTTWGRTAKGWISLYYVQVDAATSVTGVVVKTVSTDNLAVRSGAGASYEKLATYKRGNQIVILEQVTVGTAVWGRTDLGWIAMEYVK